MAAAAEAEPLLDDMDRQAGFHQQALRLADPAVDHILHRRQPGFPLEQMRQIGYADVHLSGNLLERKRLGIVPVQIFCDASHQRLVFLFALVAVVPIMQVQRLLNHQQDADRHLPADICIAGRCDAQFINIGHDLADCLLILRKLQYRTLMGWDQASDWKALLMYIGQRAAVSLHGMLLKRRFAVNRFRIADNQVAGLDCIFAAADGITAFPLCHIQQFQHAFVLMQHMRVFFGVGLIYIEYTCQLHFI